MRFACIVLACAGCYESHGRAPAIDGGRVDPPPRFDAGIIDPPIDAGALEPEAWRLVLTERVQIAGAIGPYLLGENPAVVLEAHPEHVCEQPGPIEVENSGDTIRIFAYMWRRPGEAYSERCPPITDRYEHTVRLGELGRAGSWSIIVGGVIASFEVRETWSYPWGSHLRGRPCTYTLECVAGTVCIDGSCQAPCTRLAPGAIAPIAEALAPIDAECALGDRCAEPGVCVTRDSDDCDTDADCPPGVECTQEGPFRACRWSDTPILGVGAPCVNDADCTAGQRCTEDDDDRSTCEVLCASAHHQCPGFATCLPSPARMRWTCRTSP